MAGKKDTSKLVKKVITDKNGKRKTVWVKRGETQKTPLHKAMEKHPARKGGLQAVKEKLEKLVGTKLNMKKHKKGSMKGWVQLYPKRTEEGYVMPKIKTQADVERIQKMFPKVQVEGYQDTHMIYMSGSDIQLNVGMRNIVEHKK